MVGRETTFMYSLGVWGKNYECFFEKEREIQMDQVIFGDEGWIVLRYMAVFGGMKKARQQ